MRGVLGLLVTLSLVPGAWAKSEKINVEHALILDSIVSIHNKVGSLGWEQTLANATWPTAMKMKSGINNVQVGDPHGDDDDGAFDYACVYNPTSEECLQKGARLKDDGIQILASEVLYQTLTFFKVKHVFVKLQTGAYGFRVVDPVKDANYQDLKTDQVVAAIKEFRKYVINLLCDNPDPSRVLAMMNRYEVGIRFRWDMAWALLGNKLPEASNKYMRFGPKWEAFSAGITEVERQANSRRTTLEESSGGRSQPVATGKPSVGYLANEAVGIIRLIGDTASQILQLFCVSDLSINAKLENEKQLVVYRLLSVKSQLKGRYAPLQAVIDEMNKEAARASEDDEPTIARPLENP